MRNTPINDETRTQKRKRKNQRYQSIHWIPVPESGSIVAKREERTNKPQS